MPSGGSAVDLAPYKEQIELWIETGLTMQAILQQLNRQGVRISLATYKRALARMQIRSRPAIRPRAVISQALLQRIYAIFMDLRLTDADSERLLEHEGFVIGRRRLQRLRLTMGLKKEVPYGSEEEEELLNAIRIALEQEYQEGHIADFGRNAVYSYMRSKYSFIGR